MCKDIKEILESLKTKGYSQRSVESHLDLGRNALNNTNSPELISLLKMIGAFPWLLKVAGNNYDETNAKKEFLKAFLNEEGNEEGNLDIFLDKLLKIEDNKNNDALKGTKREK